MKKILKHMGFMVFLFCMSCLLSPLEVEAARTTDTGYGKDNFARIVIDDELRKQQVASEFTLDSDADEINQILEVDSSKVITQGNTTGIVLKGYGSGTYSTGNTEVLGGSTWFKYTGTVGGASKTAIHSFHEHADNTATLDRGVSIFGDPTSTIYASGTSTNFIKLVSGNEGVSAGSSKSTPGTVNKWLVVEIAGTTHYIPAYTSKTS